MCKRIIAVVILALATPVGTAFAAASAQIVAGLVDGMTIDTGNVWGNVEVRAKSMGPGFCATNISVGDKTVAVAAPPFVYSDWQVANSHGGEVSFKLGKEDKCDTGTLAEVRYWK